MFGIFSFLHNSCVVHHMAVDTRTSYDEAGVSARCKDRSDEIEGHRHLLGKVIFSVLIAPEKIGTGANLARLYREQVKTEPAHPVLVI